MRGFLLRRIVGLIPTLLIIVVVAFLVIRLAPGSPFSADRAVSPQVTAGLEKQYGLDRPLAVQLLHYIGNVARGDLGVSTKYPQRKVAEILADGFPATLTLGFVALLWALLVGLTAGIAGALRRNSAWDRLAMGAAAVGLSLPTFVLGPLLVFVFSLTLYWFPPAGWGTFRHVVLPGITLGTVYAAYIARLTRAGLLDVLTADFIRTARAKGLKERTILWRHAMRAGLLPLVSYLGPAVAQLMVGSVVVEKIFATPGIGPYLVDAAFNRDYFLIMGIVLLYSVFLLGMNLLVDVLYGVLDPRVRYG